MTQGSQQMNDTSPLLTRRGFLAATGATATLAACGNGVGGKAPSVIDARVDATVQYLHDHFPGTDELTKKAQGVLYMPLMTQAGFFVGGAYGRGALRINGVTVDYYSATQGSVGLQFGAQQYGFVLFFMTQQALQNFRSSNGWTAGADVTYAFSDKGGNAGISTATETAPVIALVFGQAGLIAGASLNGTKYTRIIP